MCLVMIVCAGHTIKMASKSCYFWRCELDVKICSVCGCKMRRNGRTKAGRQRWRCPECGSSSVHVINNDAKRLEAFVQWIISNEIQAAMPGRGRTFRRHTERFWEIWPMPEIVDEVHKVVYVDGIYLARGVCILIACSDEHVLSWHLARSETTQSWMALLSRIAPPDVVVTDGGSGFKSAVKQIWPETRVQRCIFHAFCQVKRCTTTRPKLQAGKELYQLAKDLLHIETPAQAERWLDRFVEWCNFWNDFLKEKSIIDGTNQFTHERLRRARRSLITLINQGVLFTYLDPDLCLDGSLPATNNMIEGGVNAQIRNVFRAHRGLTLERRIKAAYWWCYMHTECPLSFAEILKVMPTNADIDILEEQYSVKLHDFNEPVKWGTGLVWNELHSPTSYPYSID